MFAIISICSFQYNPFFPIMKKIMDSILFSEIFTGILYKML